MGRTSAEPVEKKTKGRWIWAPSYYSNQTTLLVIKVALMSVAHIKTPAPLFRLPVQLEEIAITPYHPSSPTYIRTGFKWGWGWGGWGQQGTRWGGRCYVKACSWTASLLRGGVEGEPQTWAPTGKPALCPWSKYLWHLLSSHGSRVWRNGRVRNGAGQPGWHLYPSTGHHLWGGQRGQQTCHKQKQ